MVVTTASEPFRPGQGGLRPLDPIRDLRDVAELIAGAFAHDMDERGRAALRELRWMARLSPLVWWLSHIDPEFRDAFRGFVWEAPRDSGGRRVVANVNLNRAPGNRHYYIICNVVVAEEHRNQGIGRRLTESAIDEARSLAAQGTVLQVHRTNRPALHLYLDLGFHQVTGEAELRSETIPPVGVVDAVEYEVRPWQPGDGQKIYELARRAVPLALQWIRPLRMQDYWLDPWSRLVEHLGTLVTGRRTYRLVATRGDEPVAMVSATVDLRQRDHHLALLVDPAHSGRVEGALLTRALDLLSAVPARPVQASLCLDDEQALRLLESYGFHEQRTLLTMRYDFR